MTECWLPVVGYEGLYEVSDLGRVRSITRKTPYRDGFRVCQGRVLRSVTCCRWGHQTVALSAGSRGAVKKHLIHRLVMAAFVGPCPAGKEVAHLNGISVDNWLGNLVYATPGENTRHKVAHGTQLRGSSVSTAKLTEQDVLDMRGLYGLGVKVSALAKEFAVAGATVRGIVQGKRWAHV